MQPMRCNGYEIAGIGPGHGPRAKTEENKLQRLLAFVALLVVAGPACAGPASDAVKFFYLPEVKVESDPQYRSRFTEPVTKLFALNDEAQRKNPDQLACIDFAPALDAQDFDQKTVSRTLKLTETHNGDEVTVIASFDLFPDGGEEGRREMEWSLKEIGGEWKVADIASRTHGWTLSELRCIAGEGLE